MILSEVLQARLAVDEVMLVQGGRPVAEEAASQLAAQLVGELRYRAVVAPEDVFIWRLDAPLPRVVEFGAVWAPDPALGVELRGGAADGLLPRVSRSEGPGGAFPPLRLTVPLQRPAWDEFAEALLPEAELPVATYRRAGIDDVLRRFVYVPD